MIANVTANMSLGTRELLPSCQLENPLDVALDVKLPLATLHKNETHATTCG